MELHVHGDERWPMEVTSNTYFRGVVETMTELNYMIAPYRSRLPLKRDFSIFSPGDEGQHRSIVCAAAGGESYRAVQASDVPGAERARPLRGRMLTVCCGTPRHGRRRGRDDVGGLRMSTQVSGLTGLMSSHCEVEVAL